MKTQDEPHRRTLNLVTPVPVGQATLFDTPQNDELFPELDEPLPPPRPLESMVGAPAILSITCRVCGLQAKVPVGAPALLCEACSVDLVMTKNSIEARLEALDRRTEAVFDAWKVVQEETDAETMTRWARAADAGVEPPKAFAKTWAVRRTEDSALAALLCAWERMQQECETIERQRGLEQRALEEVEAWETP